jgi:transcriptional regulator with XRE-family HTH domain
VPIVISVQAYEKARKLQGITNAEVSRRTGVRYSTLRRWLTHKTLPTPGHQDRLCKVLNISGKKLFIWKEPGE